MVKKYINNIIKKVYKLDNLPFFILICIYAFFSIFMEKVGDDLFFSNVCQNRSLLNFIIERYNTWSSRIIIETILVIFTEFLPMFVWKIFNLGMFYLLVHSISKLVVDKNENKKQLINGYICILIFFIPFTLYREAGWIATLNNYLWVASTGLYTILLLKRVIENEKISIYQKIMHYLCLIYACNQEQMAGILFIIYSFGLIYLIKNKRIKPIIIITYLIIIFSIIFILICPGNIERKLSEEIRWYNGFSEISLMTKISNGINSMMDYVIKDGRALFCIFLVLLWYSIYVKSNKIIIRVIGILPLLLTIFLKYSYRIISNSETLNSYRKFYFILFNINIYRNRNFNSI